MGTQRRLRWTSICAQSRQSLRHSHKLGINVNDGLAQIQKVWLRICDIEYHELVQIYISAMVSNENRAPMQSNMSNRLHLFFTDLAADLNSNRYDQTIKLS